MFDTYQVGARSLDARVSVTEHRAPTDESVRLLREMERKAGHEVLKAIRLDSNTFKGVAHKMYDPMTDEEKYAIIFELNGERYKVYEARQRDEGMPQFCDRLKRAVADEIARNILINLANSL